MYLCEFITARKRSLEQGNIFRSVCQEFCSREGVLASVHAGILPPPGPGRHPPWTKQAPPWTKQAPQDQSGTLPGPGRHNPPQDHAGTLLGPGTPPVPGRHPLGLGTPQDQAPPQQSMLGNTVNERVVCILLECNLIYFDWI